MRKTWKLALASAALVSGVAFTACSSDDEELLSGGSDTTTVPGEVDEVKTTISFAIPHAKTQRSTADYVQENSTFQGMQNIYLMQFQVDNVGDTVKAESSFMGLMKKLDDIESNGLNSTVKVYNNIGLLPGTTAFLLYGETKASGNDGRLTPNYTKTPAASVSTAQDISFDLTPIDIPSVTEFSAALLNLRGCLRTHWGTGTGTGTMQSIFAELKKGKSSVAKEQLSYLLTQLEAALAEERDKHNLSDSINVVKEKMNAFYGESYKLPAAVYEFDWSKEEPSQKIEWNKDIIETGSTISYPPSLYYRTNSWPVTYSSSSFGSEAIAITSSMSTGVGLKQSVNYAVGRLDVKVKASSSSLKDAESKDIPLTKAGGTPAFTLTGVIVGGQPASVDFTFTNKSNDWKYMIYDNDIISGKEGITSSNTDVNTYILGLPSQKYESGASNSGKVQIALEVRNDGVAFNGKDGIIPTGATFYLVGELDPSSSSSSGTTEPKQVFASDYYTTANLTISGLANALATLPDLTTSVNDFALMVDLTWKQGISIDESVGGNDEP